MADVKEPEGPGLHGLLVVNRSKSAIQMRALVDKFSIDKQHSKHMSSMYERHKQAGSAGIDIPEVGGVNASGENEDELKQSNEAELDQEMSYYLNKAGFGDVVPGGHVLAAVETQKVYVSLIINGKVSWNNIPTAASTLVVSEDGSVQSNDSADYQKQLLLGCANGLMSDASLVQLESLICNFSKTYTNVKTAHYTDEDGNRQRVLKDSTATKIAEAAMSLRGVCAVSSDLVSAVDKHWYHGSLKTVYSYVDDAKKIGGTLPEATVDELRQLFGTMGAQALEIGTAFSTVGNWFQVLQSQLNGAIISIGQDLEASSDTVDEAAGKLEAARKAADESLSSSEQKRWSYFSYLIPFGGLIIGASCTIAFEIEISNAKEKVRKMILQCSRAKKAQAKVEEILTDIHTMEEKLNGLKQFCNGMANHFNETGQGLTDIGRTYENTDNAADNWHNWDVDRIVQWVSQSLNGRYAKYSDGIKEGINDAMANEDYDKPSQFFDENIRGLRSFGVKDKSDVGALQSMLKAKASEGGNAAKSIQLRKMLASFDMDKVFLEEVFRKNEKVKKQLLIVAGLDMFIEKEITVHEFTVIKIETLTQSPLVFMPQEKVKKLLATA